FAAGETIRAQAGARGGGPDGRHLPAGELRSVSTAAKEAEWFTFGGRIYRRERLGAQQQRLAVSGADANGVTTERTFLRVDEIDSALVGFGESGFGKSGFGKSCNSAFRIEADDAYATPSTMTRAPVFRAICGGVWLHIDGSNGSVIERLDPSRRVYPWLFAGLHRLRFPILAARLAFPTALIDL